MIDIKSKVMLGLQSGGSGELLKDSGTYYGDFEGGTAGASGYATGGSISYDGNYKIHTFTGNGTLAVTSQITDAEVLLVGGGGAGARGGGGAGGVEHYTGITITAGNKTINIGSGGAPVYNDFGGDGNNTTALGYTSSGGGGGGKTTEDGRGGGSGGGGGGSGAFTTSGGGGIEGNSGGGNGGYTASPYPAGGGGGQSSNGQRPNNGWTGGDGGNGYESNITGTTTRYAGGGGGGSYASGGYGGDGGSGGGGDGKPYGGGNGQNGTDGKGGGGGGCGQYSVGGYGGDGVVIIRYEDAADHNFDGWTEVAGTGHVFLEEADAYNDAQSVKLTDNAYIHTTESVTAGNWVIFSFYGKGDGTNGVEWEAYDVSNSTVIESGEWFTNAIWAYDSIKFKVPTGCSSMKITLESSSSAGVFADDASLYDWGTLTYTECTDVEAQPPVEWNYGFMSNEPDDNLASTGMATFHIENIDGQYSPDHANALGTFQEGMPIKIITESPDIGESSHVLNSSFELNVSPVGYSGYTPVTIQSSKVEANHSNFPILISGTFDGTGGEADLRTVANGGNIENTDANGGIGGSYTVPADFVISPNQDGSSPYDFEIEKYDASTGEIIAWVRIPTMDSASDKTIYMVYGDLAVTTSQENITSVWGSNYGLVCHFGEAGALNDSTSNGNDGNNSGSISTTGKIGDGRNFDGSNDYINFGADSSIAIGGKSFGIMTYINPDNYGGADQHHIIKKNASSTRQALHLGFDNGSNQFGLFGDDASASSGYSNGTWYLMHYVLDSGASSKHIYENGSNVATDGSSGDLSTLTDNDNLLLGVGLGGIGSDHYNGQADELRVYVGYSPSSNWVATEYNSFDVSTFLSFGSETSTPYSFDDWTISGNTTVEETEVYNGTYSVKCVDDNSGVEQNIVIEPDIDYDFVFYAKGDFYYSITDEGGGSSTGTGTHASWTEEAVSFTPSGTLATIKLESDTAGDTAYFDTVTLTPTNETLQRTKFYGIIDSIKPGWNNGYPVTKVTCIDWIGQLSSEEAGRRAIQTSKKAGESITTLLADMDDKPAAESLDTGQETFDYVFKNIATQGMDRAIYQLAWNEGGYFYAAGNGVATFKDSSARDNAESQFTIDKTMDSFEIDYNSNRRYNVISLEFNVKDATASTLLWEAPSVGVKMSANSTTIINVRYRDPETGKPTWATSVTEPSGADLAFSGANTTLSSFSDYGDSAVCTFVNTGAEETLDTFNVKGTALLERNPITYQYTHSNSVAEIGTKKFSRKFALLDDPIKVKVRADNIGDTYGPSHIGDASLTVLANQNTVLAKQLIEAEPEQKFKVSQTESGMNEEEFIIRRINYRQDGPILWVDIEANKA